jgi:P-type Cu+ transporter
VSVAVAAFAAGTRSDALISASSLTSLIVLVTLTLDRFLTGLILRMHWNEAARSAFRKNRVSIVRAGKAVVVESCEVLDTDDLIFEANVQLPFDARISQVLSQGEVEPWESAAQTRALVLGDVLSAGATCRSGRAIAQGLAREPRVFAFPHNPFLAAEQGRFSRRNQFLLLGAAFGGAIIAAASTFAASAGHLLEVLTAALSVFLTLPIAIARGALGLTYMRAAAEARTAGALFSGSVALEQAFDVDTIVISGRSGVLTQAPERIAFERFPSKAGALFDEATILGWLGEAQGTEALNSSLGKTLQSTPESPLLRKSEFFAGRGIEAEAMTGEMLVFGSRAFLLDRGIGTATADQRAAEIACNARRLVYVSVDARVVAFLAFAEPVRADARAAIERLHDTQVEPILLSSESVEACEATASDLNIDHVRADVAYNARSEEVMRLAEAGRTLAILGHPDRDAAALKLAHTALLRPAAGALTDTTENRSDIWLLADDLRTAAFGIAAAKEARSATRRTMLTLAVPAALTALAIVLGFAPLWSGPIAAALSGALVLAGLSVKRR